MEGMIYGECNTYEWNKKENNLAENSEKNIPLWRFGCKWKDSIKIGRKGIESKLNATSCVNNVIYIIYIFGLFL